MIQTKKVEIRVAFKKDNNGIYHEKHGVFIDQNNNYVSFSGSANETGAGWYSNYDSLDVWTSWEVKGRENFIKKKKDFEFFWNNMENEEVKLFHIPEAYEKKIKLKIPPYEPLPVKGGKGFYSWWRRYFTGTYR